MIPFFAERFRKTVLNEFYRLTPRQTDRAAMSVKVVAFATHPIRGFMSLAAAVVVVVSSVLAATPAQAQVTTAPEFHSATVNGASLVLTFDEDLDDTSTPAADAFTVSVAGSSRDVDSVAIDGATVTLTLALAVTAGQTVTVSYEAPTANPLKDAAGNEVATFSGESVTNNTGAVPDATLIALTVNDGTNDLTLEPAFDKAVPSYAVAAANGVATVTVSATATDTSNATVAITPADADATTTDVHEVDLSVGANAITVTVTNGAQTGAYTVTVARAPGKATGVSAAPGTASGSLDVSWTAVSVADGYKVQWKTGSQSFDASRENSVSGGSTTTHTITGLTAGHEYVVRVIAVEDDAGDGEASSEKKATPAVALPAEQTVASDWNLIPSGIGQGGRFRLLFVTSTTRNARSRNIADYDAFVQGHISTSPAKGHAAVRAYGKHFRVLGSTETVAARDHTGTTGTGVKIYWLNGPQAADDYSDFYDDTWDHQDPGHNEDGDEYDFPSNEIVWTGTDNDGSRHPSGFLGVDGGVGTGRPGFDEPISAALFLSTVSARFYGLSPVFRVGTAPTLSTATVAGAALVLTYDEALDEDSVPPADAFSVNVAGSSRDVDSVAISGMAVTLTLASAVTSGQTVTVGYTKPTSGNVLQDATGNDAANLTDEAVTNNTIAITIAADHESLPLAYTVANGTLTFTLTRSGSTTDELTATVTLAQEEAWLTTTRLTQTVTFAMGSDTATFSLTRRWFWEDDDEHHDSGDLTATVTAVGGSAVTGGASTTVYIHGRQRVTGKVSLDQETYVFDEGTTENTIYLVVRLEPRVTPSALGTFVPALSSRGGAEGRAGASGPDDYTVINGRYAISSSAFALVEGVYVARVAVSFRVVDDAHFEPDEYFRFVLNKLTGYDVNAFPFCKGETCGPDDPEHLARINASDLPTDHEFTLGRDYVLETDDTDTAADDETETTATLSFSGGGTFNEDRILTLTFAGTATPGTDFTVTPADADADVDGHQVTWSMDDTSLELIFAAVSDSVDDEVEHVDITASLAGGALSFGTQRLGVGEEEPPDTTAPEFDSATVNGAELVVTFDEDLDDTSTPAADAFAVTVAGSERDVDTVAIDGATVTLRLAAAVDHGDTVTVSYTVPSTNPLRDAAGNDAGALSNRAVTNDTRAPDATLSALTVNDGAGDLTLEPAFDKTVASYAAAVANSVATVTVAATATDTSNATVAITPADADAATTDVHEVDLSVGANAITVTVTNGAQSGAYTVTVARAPGKATDVSAAPGTAPGSLDVSWRVVSGADGYKVQWKTGSQSFDASRENSVSGGSTTTHTITGLTAGHEYVVRVIAVEDDAGDGEASSRKKATPAVALPAEQTVASDWNLIPSGIGQGGRFRLLFVTSTARNARSPHIADYDASVQNRIASMNAHSAIQSHSSHFRVLGSTETVAARDHTGTTGTGVKIYWLNGPKAADDYADFYDGRWDHQNPGRTEDGEEHEFSGSFAARLVATGSSNSGGVQGSAFLGAAAFVVGDPGMGDPFNDLAVTNFSSYRFYGLSPVFRVGTASDSTAPTLTTATAPAAGTALVLTYDEALDEESAPAANAFTVMVAGSSRDVDSVAVSGTAVTLTLASAVAVNDTVTVSYTAPAARPLQDEAGNDAANLTDEAVTNNTIAITIEADHESLPLAYTAANGTLTFTLTRSGSTTDAVTATVTLAQEKAWLTTTRLTQTVTFAMGSDTATFSLTRRWFWEDDDENHDSGDLTATVTAVGGSAVTGGASTTVYIHGRQQVTGKVSLDQETYVFDEGTTANTIYLVVRLETRVTPSALGPLVPSLSSGGGAEGRAGAIGSADYTFMDRVERILSSAFALEDGVYVARVAVPFSVVDDAHFEPDEYFRFVLNRSPGYDADAFPFCKGETCRPDSQYYLARINASDLPTDHAFTLGRDYVLEVDDTDTADDDETETTATLSFSGGGTFNEDRILTLTFAGTARPGTDFTVTPADADADADGHQVTWSMDDTSLELIFAAVSDSVDDEVEHVDITASLAGGALSFGTQRLGVGEEEPPDTTAPALDTATVIGASLVLTYDEALDDSSVPAASAFTVTVNDTTVALAMSDPVTVSGATVKLTLAAAVAPTDTVTVSYTAPATSPLQDEAGHDAANLTDQEVTKGSLAAVTNVRVAPPPFPDPDNPFFGDETPYELKVSWDRVEGADGYKVQWIAAESSFDGPDVTIHERRRGEGSRSYTIKDLSAVGSYKVRVIATREGFADAPPSQEAEGAPARGLVVLGRANLDGVDIDDDLTPVVAPFYVYVTIGGAVDEHSKLTIDKLEVTGGTVAGRSLASTRVAFTIDPLPAAAELTVTVPQDVLPKGNLAASVTWPVDSPLAVDLSTDATAPVSGNFLLKIGLSERLPESSGSEIAQLIFESEEDILVTNGSPVGEPQIVTLTRYQVTIDPRDHFEGTLVVKVPRQSFVAHANAQKYNLPARFEIEVDTKRPGLETAVVNGASLVLTYDEALDEGSVPERSAYTVEVDGSEVALAAVNAVTITGKALTLTLASAVSHGDAVTVSYAVPTGADAMPIRDGVENNVNALTNRTVTNDTPDTTAPALDTAAVMGASLVLTYDEALDAGSVPGSDSFTVEVNDTSVELATVNPVTVAGKVVTLTLDAAVAHDDTVTVSYTVPTANRLQDSAGNDAAALTNRAVTNNTADTVAPALETAAVIGASLVLRYDEALDAGSVPESGSFTVEVNDTSVELATVNPVTVAGKVVTLTLAAAVTSGQTVTVGYTKPTSGNVLQDAAGNEVATFSGESVTNNTGAPDVTLSALTVNDGTGDLTLEPAFATTETSYTASVANSVVTVTVAATATDSSNATVTITPADADAATTDVHEVDLAVGANAITVTVTNGAQSGAYTVTVARAPGKATDVSAVPGTAPGSLDVSWTAVSVADGYKVQWKTGSQSFDASRENSVSGGSTTTHTITGLTAGHEYVVRVIAVEDDAGDGEASDEAKATPTVALPAEQTVASNWSLIPSGIGQGERFRLLFVTSTRRNATLRNIADYDAFVQNRIASMNAHSAIRSHSSHFRVLGSTETVAARDHTGTTGPGTGVKIYWLKGPKAADGYADFYDGGWDHQNPGRTEDGEEYEFSGSLSARLVATGTNDDGSGHTSAFLGATSVAMGDPGTGNPIFEVRVTATVRYRFYGLSPVFRVGTASDATAPTLSTATVAGTALVLTYDEALDEDSVPPADAFTVTVAGSSRDVDSVAISGMAVTLTLASAVTSGQTVTVGYTAPPSQPLQDTAGNDAADFSNQAIDTTAPEFESAAVEGAELVVTFDEDLDEDSTPPAGAFPVNVAGSSRDVDSVAIDGATVTLTLAAAVTLGQTVTVGYTKPSSNPLQDAAGNEVATFSGESVTNNTGAPDVTLSALTVNDGTNDLTLEPAFDKAETSYAVAAANGVATVTVSATATDTSNATVAITPADADAATTDVHEVDLAVGANAITVTVTNGAQSGAYTVTVARAPGKATDVSAVPGTAPGSLDVSWTAVSVADGYKVQWKTGSQSFDASRENSVSGGSTTTHTITGLTAGHEYVVRVIAVEDDAGDGEASSEKKATPAVALPAEQTVASDWNLIPSGIGQGGRFRLLFVTSTQRNATSRNIADYDAFVQGHISTSPARGHAAVRAYGEHFRVLGSTETVAARDHTGTTGTGVKIYWLNGPQAADDYSDFYDDNWDHQDPGHNEDGDEYDFLSNEIVWTGTDNDGSRHPSGFLGASLSRSGRPGSDEPISAAGFLSAVSARFYGLSPVFKVGTASDATAPTLDTATVDGASLVLTYDEALDEDSVPPADAFTVTVAGSSRDVDSVAISGMAVTLTLASAVTSGQTVTVGYTAPPSQPLQDTAGNDAADFSNRAIDTTAPEFDSATVDGASLVVTFDEDLDEDSAPAAGAFTVTVAGSSRDVDTVAIDGATVTLTLASAATLGQTVTVGYTKPTSGDVLQDAAGNGVATFSGESVTNNTGAPDVTLSALTVNDGTNDLTLEPAFDKAETSYAVAAANGVATVTVSATATDTSNATVAITPADADAATTDVHEVDLAVGANAITVTVTNGAQTGTYTVTVARAPGTVTGVSVAPGTASGSLEVSWTAVSGADGYKVQWKTGILSFADRQHSIDSGSATTHTITGLTVGHEYVVRVIAVEDDAGDGEASDEAKATPTVALPAEQTVASNWSLIPSGIGQGERFRLLFVTSTKRNATLRNIADYDAFVQNRIASMNAHSAIRSHSSHFRVLGSTETVAARDHTGTTGPGTGVKIYWLKGPKAADGYADFYDGGWDHQNPGRTEDGEEYEFSGSGVFRLVSTGTNDDGSGHTSAFLGATSVAMGDPGTGNPIFRWRVNFAVPYRFYGLSPVFQVGTASDTTAPMLDTATVDGASLVLTYDEALDEDSVPPADAFTVTVAGSSRDVDSVAISGMAVTLTLASAVTSGQTVDGGLRGAAEPAAAGHGRQRRGGFLEPGDRHDRAGV